MHRLEVQLFWARSKCVLSCAMGRRFTQCPISEPFAANVCGWLSHSRSVESSCWDFTWCRHNFSAEDFERTPWDFKRSLWFAVEFCWLCCLQYWLDENYWRWMQQTKQNSVVLMYHVQRVSKHGDLVPDAPSEPFSTAKEYLLLENKRIFKGWKKDIG